jgi:hypothetical protein
MRRFLAAWNKPNSGPNKNDCGQNKPNSVQNKPNSGLLYWQKDCERWELTRNNCKLDGEKSDRAIALHQFWTHSGFRNRVFAAV